MFAMSVSVGDLEGIMAELSTMEKHTPKPKPAYMHRMRKYVVLIGAMAACMLYAQSSVTRSPVYGRSLPAAGSWDICIVGAGLSGTVMAERYATILQKTSLIIDSRTHVGGNCFDEREPTTGILMNLYGAHLFHTNIERVWSYVNLRKWAGKCPWVHWEHRVVGVVDDKEVPIPVNIVTVNRLMGTNISSEAEMISWLQSVQVKCDGSCRNAEEMAVSRSAPSHYHMLLSITKL